jgi:hypothetical protein
MIDSIPANIDEICMQLDGQRLCECMSSDIARESPSFMVLYYIQYEVVSPIQTIWDAVATKDYES